MATQVPNMVAEPVDHRSTGEDAPGVARVTGQPHTVRAAPHPATPGDGAAADSTFSPASTIRVEAGDHSKDDARLLSTDLSAILAELSATSVDGPIGDASATMDVLDNMIKGMRKT